MGSTRVQYIAGDSDEEDTSLGGEKSLMQGGLLRSEFGATTLKGGETTGGAGQVFVTEFSPGAIHPGVEELQVTAEAVCAVASGHTSRLAFATVLVIVVAVDASRSQEVKTGRMDWVPLLLGTQHRQKDYVRPLPPGALGVDGVTVACVGRMDVGSSEPCSRSMVSVMKRNRHGVVFEAGVRWLMCSVFSFTGCTEVYVYGRGTLHGR
jgi:hypothetical protein